jgi:hypothetical protein
MVGHKNLGTTVLYSRNVLSSKKIKGVLRKAFGKDKLVRNCLSKMQTKTVIRPSPKRLQFNNWFSQLRKRSKLKKTNQSYITPADDLTSEE